MAGLGETLFLFSIFGLYIINSIRVSDFTERLTEPPHNTSSYCIEIQPKLLSTGEKNYLIWFHRSLRENVSKQVSGKLPKAFFMKKITWHNALAKMARRWAVQCINGKDVELEEFIGQYITESVENSDKVKLKDLLQTWKVGLGHLTPHIIARYRQPKQDEFDYEHLAQILWWNTEYFGCGKSVYKRNCLSNDCVEHKTTVKLVCNYFPKGNKPGKPVYITGENKNLICRYDPENNYCTSEEYYKAEVEEMLARSVSTQEEREGAGVEYRTRNRMIELWPAAESQVNAWQTFNIKIFHLCVTLTLLPYFKYLIC